MTEFGSIKQNQLLQAKNLYYDIDTLLGNEPWAQDFYDGTFATFYLSPRDYHRVHMPLQGVLKKTLFIPGKLFSVNRMTSEIIPNLYSRNERFICLFDSPAGPMVVILVGAMIVGSIQTSWMDEPIRTQPVLEVPQNVSLAKGGELGYFKMGSTVIVIFQKDRIEWTDKISPFSQVQFGQFLGNFH